MIEMLGVLAVIAVLSVGGIAGYSKAMTKFKVNKTIDMITSAIVNTKTAFANEKNYSALNGNYTQRVIDDLNLLPKDRKTPLGGSIDMHEWCEEIDFEDVNPYYDTYTPQNAFRICISDINSKEACLDLLSYDLSQAGVTLVDFGYTMDNDNCGNNMAKTPINPTDVSIMCADFNSKDTGCNSMCFYIGTKPESECVTSFIDMFPDTFPINFNPF